MGEGQPALSQKWLLLSGSLLLGLLHSLWGRRISSTRVSVFHILSALFPSWQLFFLAQMLFWAQGNSQLSRSLLKPCNGLDAKSTLRTPSVMRRRTTSLSSWQEVGRAFSPCIPSFPSSPLGYWRSQMHIINLKLVLAWSAVQLLP